MGVETKKETFEFILQEGEGFGIEFKEAFDPKSIAREMVALANSEGGKIILGIDDTGKVKGIKIDNKLKSQIQDLARNCDPAVSISLEKFEDVLIINVKKGKNKPYKCSQGFFIRQGANSQKMSTSEIIDFLSEEGKLKFDKNITTVKKYDTGIVAEYLNKAGIKQGINKNVLFNLGVTNEDGFLNNAGVLFFTKQPKKYLINAYITCVRYRGTDRVNIIDRKDFEDDLVSQVEQAINFIQRNTRLEYEIKGLRRKEISEYPLEAVREAVLNAVMHRDYFEEGANVQVDIFDDRLTVTSVGGLIKPLTKATLGTLSIRRNPLIADLFHRIHFIEKIGSGIKRMKDACKQHGNIKFKIETNGYFVTEFALKNTPKTYPKHTQNIPKTYPKTGELILELIKKNKNITKKEIIKQLGLTLGSVKHQIKNLKKDGLITWVGLSRDGYWEVRNDFNPTPQTTPKTTPKK